MRRRSPVYTVIFISVLSLICASALSLLALTLKERRLMNEQADIQKSLLEASGIISRGSGLGAQDLRSIFSNRVELFLLAEDGSLRRAEGEAALKDFIEGAEGAAVFLSRTSSGKERYTIPLKGSGLWGRIDAFISVEGNGSTIAGVNFYKHEETPGLGAEIGSGDFQKRFEGKELFRDGEFYGVKVLKSGSSETDKNSVDGISGATMTGDKVSEMISGGLKGYDLFLKELKNSKGRQQ